MAISKKSLFFGRESGKSSTRWFGGSGGSTSASAIHGTGARAGNGTTTDDTILGKILPVFRSTNRKPKAK